MYIYIHIYIYKALMFQKETCRAGGKIFKRRQAYSVWGNNYNFILLLKTILVMYWNVKAI